MTEHNTYPFLDTISSPKDLKALPEEDLAKVCDEMRAFLLESVQETGGHLAVRVLGLEGQQGDELRPQVLQRRAGGEAALR